MEAEGEGRRQRRIVESREAEKMIEGEETARAVIGAVWPRRVATGSISERELCGQDRGKNQHLSREETGRGRRIESLNAPALPADDTPPNLHRAVIPTGNDHLSPALSSLSNRNRPNALQMTLQHPPRPPALLLLQPRQRRVLAGLLLPLLLPMPVLRRLLPYRAVLRRGRRFDVEIPREGLELFVPSTSTSSGGRGRSV